MRLDNKDRKILGLLAENSRMPYTQLAKKLRSERNAVKYRVNKLVKNGVIRAFETELDFHKLGYKEYLCYMGFYKFDNITKNKIIDFLKNHDFIKWIGECFGKYQIKIRLSAVDEEHLYKILSELEKNCSLSIRRKTVLQITGFVKQRNESLFSSARIKKPQKDLKIKLDKKDLLILRKLCENNRETLISFFDQTKLSPEAVRLRIKKLEKAGVIAGHTININHKALGIVMWGNMLVKFKDPKKVLSKLKEFALQKKSIGRSFALFGEWNAELGFAAENTDVLHDLVGEFLTKFSTELVDYEIVFNQEAHKFPPTPMGVFK
ncbi:AsnC family transcriptional regulator [Candidatus Woesearchaeota archaeon]|nr:AsnC family transcriptional regulator [Candidatus Woesearchaeota archaeon]MBW3017814.1 AsnC family transcriptional regulator [Candidatus Woesearchaeota archaeon]